MKPEFERMPGYPVFLATVRAIAGPSDYAVIVVQSAVHALGTYALFYLVYVLLQDLTLALLVEIGWALYPFAIYFTISFMSEGLATEALVGAFAGLVAFVRSRSRIALALGIASALVATYTRPNLVVLPFFLWGLACLSRRRRRTLATRGLAIMSLVLAAAQVPWVVRNYVAFGKPIVGSHNYISANFCESSVQFQLAPDDIARYCYGGVDRAWMNECDFRENLRYDAIFRERALAQIRAHPARVVGFALFRPVRVWFTYHFEHIPSPRLQLLARVLTIGMLPPFVMGCVLLWRRTELGWIPTGVCLFIALIHLVLVVSARYAMPARPFYLLAVVYVVVGIVRNGRAIVRRDWGSIRWPGESTTA